MSIQIQKVYQETQAAYQLHPLTGDAGMTREFSWVQLCEDIENIKFFRGNELVITTGLMSDHETWMKSFVERLIRYRASGLILNVGKYVTSRCRGASASPTSCRITASGCCSPSRKS